MFALNMAICWSPRNYSRQTTYITMLGWADRYSVWYSWITARSNLEVEGWKKNLPIDIATFSFFKALLLFLRDLK